MFLFNRTHSRPGKRQVIIVAQALFAAGLMCFAGLPVLARVAPNAAGTPRIEVTKTAFVTGQNVCGVIRIKNTGAQPATVTQIIDWLEVHFPSNVTPPALPPGSTSKWYRVANVPISLPGPIAPGVTATIDYCYSLCLAADSPGANSMRNVVTVTAANPNGSVKSFTTRSTSFAPPILDCRACCLPDGSCIDTLEADCVASSGVPGEPGTDCASTQCTQACCLDSFGTCLDLTVSDCEAVGTPQGPGTTCAANECPQGCCFPDGTCIEMGPNACQAAGGVPLGPGSNCLFGCPQACCLDSFGTCQDLFVSDCEAVGFPQGPGTTCAANECPQGCCFPDGTCIQMGPNACQAAGGVPLGPGSVCGNGCPQACCFDFGICEDLFVADCLQFNGFPQGPGTTCGTIQCGGAIASGETRMTNTPCSLADLTGDQMVDVSDLLAVINAWKQFPSGRDADIAPLGGDRAVAVSDALSIINNWGACP